MGMSGSGLAEGLHKWGEWSCLREVALSGAFLTGPHLSRVRERSEIYLLYYFGEITAALWAE